MHVELQSHSHKKAKMLASAQRELQIWPHYLSFFFPSPPRRPLQPQGAFCHLRAFALTILLPRGLHPREPPGAGFPAAPLPFAFRCPSLSFFFIALVTIGQTIYFTVHSFSGDCLPHQNVSFTREAEVPSALLAAQSLVPRVSNAGGAHSVKPGGMSDERVCVCP